MTYPRSSPCSARTRGTRCRRCPSGTRVVPLFASFLLDGPLRYRRRFLLTSANGRPAFGTYLWDEERGVFAAAALDVVDVRDGHIAEVVSFLDPELFPAFGLPAELFA